jgi:hypothetical protein
MRSLWIGLLLGAFGIVAAGPDARAESPDTRVADMPFTDCLEIIAETSQEVDEKPVTLVSTGDLTTVRIHASDGFVTVSCSRPDNRMTLTKSPVPAAAGMSASR